MKILFNTAAYVASRSHNILSNFGNPGIESNRKNNDFISIRLKSLNQASESFQI